MIGDFQACFVGLPRQVAAPNAATVRPDRDLCPIEVEDVLLPSQVLQHEGETRSTHVDAVRDIDPLQAVRRIPLGSQRFGEVLRIHRLHHKDYWVASFRLLLCERLDHRARVARRTPVAPHRIPSVGYLPLLAGEDRLQILLGVRTDLHENDGGAGPNDVAHSKPSSSSRRNSSSCALP